MSSQLKEKKEQQPEKRDERADFLFNQHIVRTVAYTAAGFGVGMLASLLFKHKAGMTLFFAGTGAGYGGANFINDLTNYRKSRNLTTPTQIPSQKIDQRRFERRDDDRSGTLQQAKENVKEGAGELSNYMAGKVNQAARGIDETGRNLAEKTKKEFKEFSRGGDDDSKEKKESTTPTKKESTAKGLEESAKNLAEKAKKEFKEFSRGGDDSSKEKKEQTPTKKEPSKGGDDSSKEKKESGKAGDKNETVNIKGQTFQSFKSNPAERGKEYEQGRSKAKEPAEEEKRRQVGGLRQESGGVDSIKKNANIRLPNDPSDPAFYGKKTDVATVPIKNKVEAGEARDKRN